ncbi:hypothetical protein [Sphingobium cupriresistens]|uniref:Uncharacterized protein n=1 Tax=Sphingobium cupriresistens LL01 TaxID=1420583 RepID=A0A0J7XQ56_9SPHN|nr:hypothetical protein [Sphingobium cupriresistens]KMS53183.1 hypothetical protein V473_19570 [Sphingobium cupriresistens LL01]
MLLRRTDKVIACSLASGAKASDRAGSLGEEHMSKDGPQDVRDIVLRMEQRPSNPIRRARLMVEQEVPPARRGPGWDRHWRELEAYLDEGIAWTVPQGLDDARSDEDKKRADPKTSP